MADLAAYMIDFEPYRGGNNPKHKGDSQTFSYLKIYSPRKKTEILERINKWLKERVKGLKGKDKQIEVVITLAPGHEENSNPSGFMHDIVKTLLDDKDCSLIDGRQQLIRTKTVPKQSTTPGSRDESTHRGTIAIKGTPDNKGKVVIVLDDIWTSGSTLRVCREVMLTTNPKQVILLAIGKTVPSSVSSSTAVSSGTPEKSSVSSSAEATAPKKRSSTSN